MSHGSRIGGGSVLNSSSTWSTPGMRCSIGLWRISLALSVMSLFMSMLVKRSCLRAPLCSRWLVLLVPARTLPGLTTALLVLALALLGLVLLVLLRLLARLLLLVRELALPRCRSIPASSCP